MGLQEPKFTFEKNNSALFLSGIHFRRYWGPLPSETHATNKIRTEMIVFCYTYTSTWIRACNICLINNRFPQPKPAYWAQPIPWSIRSIKCSNVINPFCSKTATVQLLIRSIMQPVRDTLVHPWGFMQGARTLSGPSFVHGTNSRVQIQA